MNCQTEEEAIVFLSILHQEGRYWNNGDSYIDITHWSKYGVNTCYYFNLGKFSKIEKCKKDCKIIYAKNYIFNGFEDFKVANDIEVLNFFNLK